MKTYGNADLLQIHLGYKSEILTFRSLDCVTTTRRLILALTNALDLASMGQKKK